MYQEIYKCDLNLLSPQFNDGFFWLKWSNFWFPSNLTTQEYLIRLKDISGNVNTKRVSGQGTLLVDQLVSESEVFNWNRFLFCLIILRKKKQLLLWLTSEILLQPWTYKINSVINLGLPQWIFPESNLISRHQNSKLARSETAVPSIICQNPDPPPYSLVSSNKFNSCRSTCGTIYFI